MKSAQIPVSLSPDDIPRDGGIWPEYASTMVICFQGIDQGTAYGELWSFYYQDPRPFRGLDQLLFTMEALMDEAGYPEVWCESRHWGPQPEDKGKRDLAGQTPSSSLQRQIPAYGPNELISIKGTLCTIRIRVYCRQHASIQGTAQNCKEIVHFRSALELMKLLQEALQISTPTGCQRKKIGDRISEL